MHRQGSSMPGWFHQKAKKPHHKKASEDENSLDHSDIEKARAIAEQVKKSIKVISK